MQETQETRVPSLGRENALKEEIASGFSIFAWEIPWRSMMGYSSRGCKESDMTKHTYTHTPGQRDVRGVRIFQH